MTLLQQIMPMPIPIYTDSTPLTKEQGNAMLGVFILLNFLAVVWIAIRTVKWFIAERKKTYPDYTWFEMLINPLFGEIFLILIAIIDGLVILLLIGDWIGNTLLKK